MMATGPTLRLRTTTDRPASAPAPSMPWIDPIDEVARPPRLVGLPAPTPTPAPAPAPVEPAEAQPSDSEPADSERVQPEIVDGWADLHGPQPQGATIDLRGAERIEATEASFVDNRFLVAPHATLVVRRCVFVRCDLSQLRLESIRGSTLTECKLMGAELGRSAVDVELVRCSLALARLRGATLTRVRFEGCTLTGTDAFEAELVDVSFDQSSLTEVDLDRARFQRVDLRGAADVDVRNAASYEGCVITMIQAQGLAIRLAHDAGFSLEAEG